MICDLFYVNVIAVETRISQLEEIQTLRSKAGRDRSLRVNLVQTPRYVVYACCVCVHVCPESVHVPGGKVGLIMAQIKAQIMTQIMAQIMAQIITR